MSSDLSPKKSAHTGVFWDVEDFPVPEGRDPDSIYRKIKSALAKKGYRGEVDMMAYGEKNKIRDEFSLAGIIVVPLGDKCARVNRMLKDILFWALDNPVEQSVIRNVMVISKNTSEDIESIHVLQGLHLRGYKIFLVESDHNVQSMKQHEFVRSVWLWTSLFDGGYPIGKSGSPQSVDNKLKRKEPCTALCSGSAEGVDNRQGLKKMKPPKENEIRADTD